MPFRNVTLAPLGIPIAASIFWDASVESIIPSQPTSGGSSPDQYSFAGTGYRWPVTSQSEATNTYFVTEWHHHTPDYETTDTRFAACGFWSPTSGGEVSIATGENIIIQGVSIETGTDVWTQCDGASESGVATIDENNLNALLPRVQATLAGNTSYRCRMAFKVSATSVAIPRNTLKPGASAPGGQGRVEGDTTTRFGRIAATGSNLTNSGGAYYVPPFAVAKGGDGRICNLVTGDSIGYGANDTQADIQWTARNAVGYIEQGFDDNSTGLRIASHIMCIPGQRPVGASGWYSSANWSGKIAALQLVNTETGRLPFDEIINQHITNSIPYSGTLRDDMVTFFDLLASEFGRPVYQVEGLPSVDSSDGFATVVNQAPKSGYVAAGATQGHLWAFNADVGGTDGLGDATAYYRANDKIAGSIAPWRLTSANTTTDRDKYAVRAFLTTLASAYISGNTVSLANPPDVGVALNMAQDAGGFGTPVTVASVSGTGPYSVTLSSSPGTASASGNAVLEAFGDTLHPSGVVHDVLSGSIVSYKVARGWIAPASSPSFTSSSVSGTAEDGETLTANATATGNPTPTFAYQWQKNGADISGETAITIVLDESTMSLSDGDTISCEITATNSEGSANAEPSTSYVAASGAVATFLATINASSESGFFDFTDATINGSSRFESLDQNGGVKFESLGTSLNPTIDATLGAVYTDATTLIARTQSSDTYTIVMTLTKSDGVGDSADAFLDSSTRIRSGSATALPYTTTVDDVSVSTRGDLYTALDDEAEHTVVMSGQSSTQLRIGRSGSGFEGSVRRCAVINETDAGGSLATWTSDAVAAVDAG